VTVLKRCFKSPNPAFNVAHCNEAVACDIVYSDFPAISNGSVAAVHFVGIDSQVTDVYGIKNDMQVVNTLEDTIIQRGAPHKHVSDSAQVIIGKKLKISCEPCVSVTDSVNHTNNIRMRLNAVIKLSNFQLTACLTEPVPRQTLGYYVCNIYAIS
jgi:hypothetical protein